MRLQSYLTEGSRSQRISFTGALDIIEGKCKKFFSSNVRIFRGLPEEHMFLYVNPREGKPRTSANTANYYTFLVDSLLPSWKEYPKRSYSLICSSDYSVANTFGEVFLVFPFDGSKIGICDTLDFWSSFPNLERMGGPEVDGDQMDIFNIDLSNMFKMMDMIKRINSGNGYLYGKTLKEFSDALDRLNVMIDDGSIEKAYGGKRNILPPFYNFLKRKKKNENLIDYFDNVLSPSKNGFSLVKAGSVTNLPKEREVWTEGPAVLISAAADFTGRGDKWIEWRKKK